MALIFNDFLMFDGVSYTIIYLTIPCLLGI